jgi:hypothetical protein
MTEFAVLASPRDGEYASAVATVLKKLGAGVSVSDRLPEGGRSRVVLVWSAALEELRRIDGPALVGFWSEGRLTIVLRDATPLPLGMRDLPSLPPGTPPREVVDALSRPDAALPSKPEDVKSAASGRRSGAPVYFILGLLLVLAGGAYWYSAKEQRAKQAELTSRLETAAKASEELNRAKQAQAEVQNALADLRARLQDAEKSGNLARARELEAQVRLAEGEAAKRAQLVRERELTAADARAKAMTASEEAKKSAPAAVAKSAPKTEVAAAAPKAEAPKAEAQKAEAPKAGTPKAKTRSERAEVASTPPPVASATPSAPAAAASPEVLFAQAQAMEGSDPRGALRIYRSLARQGNGKAAKRLGEIYDRGIPGVPRDYQESLSWFQVARELGETVETASRRSEGEASRVEAPKAAAPPAEEKQAKAALPAAPAAAPAADQEPEWPKILVALAVLALAAYAWRRSQKPAPKPAAAPVSAPPAAEGGLLFVSYSHKDKPRIEPIVSMIEQTGRKVWIDRTDITGQAGWAGQIVRAIRQSRAVVLMASPNSYASDQVVRELYLAMNHKKPIVPIEIEPAELPDELQYILAPFQRHKLTGSATSDVLGRALSAV